MRTRSAEVEALMDLLEQVRATPGRDRKLDVRILALVQQPGEWSAADIEHACVNPERTCCPPEYTDSIGAALALVDQVLPGAFFLFGRGRTRPDEPLYAFDLRRGTDESLGEAEHEHGPLAILAALLTAKLALMEAADVQG